MTDNGAATFEEGLIADMRAHHGEVTSGPLKGHPIMIAWSEGAKSGERRRALLTYSRDGEDYVVAGTAGGSAKPPAWFHNMSAHPRVAVEIPPESFDVDATAIADGPERDRLWDQHVAQLPHFADYPAQTGRVIPMVRLRRA